MARSRPARPLLAAFVFTALAIMHTWPLATDLRHLSRVDNADTQLNAWAISWVAHQLAVAPHRLFDANIFYPERYTLAFSEPLIPPAVAGAPMRWIGASPITTYNALVLGGFVATALGMHLLAVRFTGDFLAGLLAGSVFAFNTHLLTRIPHLQGLHMQWLPLALWALDRLLGDRGGRRDAWWLAVFVILAALTSGYLAIFTVVTLAVAFLSRPDAWCHRHWRPVVARIAAAAAGVTLVAAVTLWPYAIVDQGHALQRSLAATARHSATLDQYLASAGRVHHAWWSSRFYEGDRDSFFPGLVAIGLAIVALTWRATDRRRRRMLGAIALVGFVLSLGPATPLYGWLYAAFPPVQAIRASSRFGVLVILGIAGLASLAIAAMRQRASGRGWSTAAAIVCIALVNAEGCRAPIDYVRFQGFSPIYTMIARDAGAQAVAELPFPTAARIGTNADFVLASTVHWKPLLNGYSGMIPDSYREHASRLRGFPGGETVPYLRELGITHIVVHTSRYGTGQARRVRNALDAHEDLQLMAVDEGGRLLYRVRDRIRQEPRH